MKAIFAAALLLILPSAPAAADPVTRTFTFDASNFLIFDPAFPPPFDHVQGSFSITVADTTQSIFDSSNLVLFSISSPLENAALFSYYSYAPGEFALSVGGASYGASNVIGFPTTDFYDWRIDILDPFGDPTIDTFIYSTPPSGLTYRAGSSKLSVGAVPEPSVWGLMIVGFSILSGSLRRSNRRKRFAEA